MLDSLTKNLHSITKSLEIIYVIEGIKDASRIIVNEEQLNNCIGIFKNFNLHVAISDFKIKKEVDELRGYSDKGFRIDKNSSEKGQVFLYVSRKKENAEKAKYFEANNEHYNFGKILGYPECCIDFFTKNFPIESKKKNDYVLASLKNSDGYKFPFYNNVAIRHLDLTLLSHFPCNFNCKASLEIAKLRLKSIRALSPELYEIFDGMLKCAVIYTENDCIFALREVNVKENEIYKQELYYNGIIGSMNNNLYTLLKAQEKIKINNKNDFNIGEINIKGDGFGVLVFV